MVLKGLALKTELSYTILLQGLNVYICVKCKFINNTCSEINATIVKNDSYVDTANNAKLEVIITYITVYVIFFSIKLLP